MAAIKYYFDEMLSRAAAQQLTSLGIDVLMAIDAGMTGKADTVHLQYATEQQRVMVTFDRPFAGKVMNTTDHAGLICLTSIRQHNIGGVVRLLDEFARQYAAEDTDGRVLWL